VDQISVLEVADAFITHCGMNSTSEGLYYVIPLILFPQTTEQKGVATRVMELGAGELLESVKTPENIKNIVLKVLKDNTLKENAKKISDSFKACGNAKEAVKFIENKIQKN
jgi:UDP:flavonoid glycosyltransferase YjiC (YdhE family)